MGTTKLTRKEILAEDPVHEAIVGLIGLTRAQGKTIALVAAVALLIAAGVYFGIRYMDSRDSGARRELAKAMELYHGQIDPNALDDPYGKGATPLFRSETAKYEYALKAFSPIVSQYSSSKQAVIARYYTGLIQLKLGQKQEAVQSLEAVRGNTKDRTVGYLAKKVLASHLTNEGNFKGAQEILEGMINDPQCELPKEDLRLSLSRIYTEQGKSEQAMKVLVEGREQSSLSPLQSMLAQEITKLEAASPGNRESLKPAEVSP